jgi:hypothetical protein
MRKTATLLIAILIISTISYSQNIKTTNALGQTIEVSKAVRFKKTIPARDFPETEFTPVNMVKKHIKERHNQFKRNEDVNPNATPIGEDPIRQKKQGDRPTPNLDVNFDGISGSAPPDPSGAAGNDYYVQAINTWIKVYTKNGNGVGTQFSLASMWPGSDNDGDPIVMYDRHADRWFISQFNDPARILIAISETNDPTGSYYTYDFALNQFPDYPKYSIWWDGYYMTSNSSHTAVVFEREKMLTGDPNAKVIFLSAPSVKSAGFTNVLPADADGELPPDGTPCYFFNLEDNSWNGVPQDQIKVYEMSVDWANTSNTAITISKTLATDPFSTSIGPGFDNISQPGTTQRIDGIPGVLMYRAQYMRWMGYNTIVLNHVVDANGLDQAGIRWYELRDADDGDWTIYQQGTYAPDGAHRWMGSISMDILGNIALAYSYCYPDSNHYPGLRYTGRLSYDPLGEMTVDEGIAINGLSSQTGYNRYGDYAQMTLDPDGETFWYTGEYLSNNQNVKTRIFSYRLSRVNASVTNKYINILDLSTRVVNGKLNVSINGLANNDLIVAEILSINGKSIVKKAVFPNAQAAVSTFNINNLSSGIYFIRIGNTNFQKVEKFVITE